MDSSDIIYNHYKKLYIIMKSKTKRIITHRWNQNHHILLKYRHPNRSYYQLHSHK
jgi:hypothetical protein